MKKFPFEIPFALLTLVVLSFISIITNVSVFFLLGLFLFVVSFYYYFQVFDWSNLSQKEYMIGGTGLIFSILAYMIRFNVPVLYLIIGLFIVLVSILYLTKDFFKGEVRNISKDEMKRDGKVRTKMAKTCQVCGKLIAFDDETCPYCSGEIEEEKEVVERKKLQVQCPSCKKMVDFDLDVCPHCGREL
jgi:RNA polymerase subunit RPABC4/transcription elongation factor Spt4